MLSSAPTSGTLTNRRTGANNTRTERNAPIGRVTIAPATATSIVATNPTTGVATPKTVTGSATTTGAQVHRPAGRARDFGFTGGALEIGRLSRLPFRHRHV